MQVQGHFVLIRAVKGEKPSQEKIKRVAGLLKSRKLFGQVIALKVVASERQALYAVEQTISAFKEGSNFSKDKSIELLQRMCAERQFSKLLEKLEKLGFQEENLVIIAGEKDSKEIGEAFKEVLGLLEASEEPKLLAESLEKKYGALKRFYSVREEEIECVGLEEAIIERVALTPLK